jgi:hypothetical protein
MIIRKNLDKVFGPFGSSMGFFLFLGGVITAYYVPFSLIIAVIGAFVSLTSTSTFIDYEKKRIKFSNNLFGVFPAGKWIDIVPGMKLGLKKAHKGYQAYIRGNQPIGIHIKDIRIYLYGPDNKQIMPIDKFDSYESAKIELTELSDRLGLDIIR